MKASLVLLSGFALASFAPLQAAPTVTTAAGAMPADITAAVSAFRNQIGLGAGANAANGPFASGFRNVNWDGAPDTVSSPNPMPGDFFNSNVRRGVEFSTPGTHLEMSADSDNPTATPVRFAHLDPSYSTRFRAFTEQRLFAAIGSTVVDTTFFVPGSPDTPATVNGFGVVFCDVDLAASTSLEFFDADGMSLGKWYATAADNGLSFLGVFFGDGERVARVRVTHGNRPLAAGNIDTAEWDIVATDDFMFGEPLPLATDATLINVSNRASVGTGNEIAITGFVVRGTEPKMLLVRAVGPSLAQFLPTGTLANPQLALANAAGEFIATNDDWADRPEVAQAAARVGAFPLTAGSTDAALLVVVNPGVYTVLVSGVNGGTGIALSEVYEVP